MNHVERKKNGLPYRYDDPALLGDQHIYQDIPENVIACGVPCRVVRPIGEKDRQYYYKDRVLDVWE